jgi:hypothetical protein
MTPAQRDALRAALGLPYPSFPADRNKVPTTPHGFKDATLPHAGLATLWSRFPGELIGVPTGEASGLAVLDVDRKPEAREWYLLNKHRLPETRIHRTRSGGLHLLFKHRPGLRCSIGRIAPGIDIRAGSSCFTWWPATGLEVRDHELAEWPDFLTPAPPPIERPARIDPSVALTLAKRDRLNAQVVGIAKCVERSSKGERNAVLFWGACRIGDLLTNGALSGLVSREWCADLLALAARRAGLPVIETRRTIASAFRRAAA